MATAKKGSFVWYEHMARDPKAAIGFYSDVVGWRTQPFTEGAGDYTMWVGSQGPLGGEMKLEGEAARMGARPQWLAHVQVDDVDATAALAKKLGGEVYKDPTDIPSVGRFAVIADPQGATLSIFKPETQAMELHDVSKPGEFCWNELTTTDSAGALQFYAQLFGWTILEEMDMGPLGKYRVFGQGGQRLGGMMDAPKDARLQPRWLYYTETGDLDAAIGRATAKGAKVVHGPEDVPGGGRIAQLSDPEGAAFALHQSPALRSRS